MSRSVSAPSSVTNTSPCWKGLIVPGSTFRYGSHFCRVTLKPRLSRRQPIEEAATPFPSEETTPPVTKIYFGAIRVARVPSPGLSALHRIDVHIIMFGTRESVKSNLLALSKRYSFLSLAAKPFRAKRVYTDWGYSPLPFAFSKMLLDRKLQPVHTNRRWR